MADPQVTIVVVPRERFSYTERSLESIYEHTTFPFSLIYVDGGSPARIKRYLQAEAQRKGFQLIRTNHYLPPNRARNIGLRHVKSKYVVFIDNDVLVTPGWLEPLVQCAEETGAWVVGPLYLEGELSAQVIHMAGGTVEIKDEQGQRKFMAKMRLLGKRLPEVTAPLKREQTDYVEFHCMLMQRDVFEQLGPLDEKLFSTREHIDVGMTVRQAGGTVYIEPASVIAFLVPEPPIALSDVPFLMLRWSEAWNQASVEHFQKKWDVRLHDKQLAILRHHRHVLIAPLRRLTNRVFGWRADKIERTYVYPLEKALNRLLIRKAE